MSFPLAPPAPNRGLALALVGFLLSVIATVPTVATVCVILVNRETIDALGWVLVFWVPFSLLLYGIGAVLGIVALARSSGPAGGRSASTTTIGMLTLVVPFAVFVTLGLLAMVLSIRW